MVVDGRSDADAKRATDGARRRPTAATIAVVGGVALVYTDARLGSGPGRIMACGEDQRMEVGLVAWRAPPHLPVSPAFAFQRRSRCPTAEEGGGDAHRVLDVVVEIGREALGTEAVVNLVARRVGAWPRRYGRWRTRRFVYLFQLMLRFPPWGEEADYHSEYAVHTTSDCESN